MAGEIARGLERGTRQEIQEKDSLRVRQLSIGGCRLEMLPGFVMGGAREARRDFGHTPFFTPVKRRFPSFS